MRHKLLYLCIVALLQAGVARTQAGPYPPAVGVTNSTAVARNDPAIHGWATGWTNYINGANCSAQWQNPSNALGVAEGNSFNIVCLGDGGQITMTFNNPIRNGPGYDFAVFENSFNDTFLELAYCEVSSDGTNFARFPCHSLTTHPVPEYGASDPTDIDGLAGKYRQGFGTPFDLAKINDPLIDIGNIRFVRLIDIIGNASYLDSSGNIIYDPYPNSGSAGFDLDAIAIIVNPADTPLERWRQITFGADSGSQRATDTADWDSDGIPNLLEYALKTDARHVNSSPFTLSPKLVDGRVRIRVQFQKRADATDVEIILSSTGDLQRESWSVMYCSKTGTTNNLTTLEAIDEESGRSRRFYRLDVKKL